MTITLWTATGEATTHEKTNFTIVESGALLIDYADGRQLVYAPTAWVRLETVPEPTQ